MVPLKTSLLTNEVASPLHAHTMELVTNTTSLEERSVAINNLEQGVREVSELFTDIGLLVQEQGEQIDNIEITIQHSDLNISNANKELVRASQYQARTRKCYIKCGCVIIGILTCIIIIVIFTRPKGE